MCLPNVCRGRSRVAFRDVTFAGVGGLQLHGTLLMPDGPGPHSALLLLPGSGPSDRDGNQPGLQMNVLKDIAERLAKEGVASLRFDKRAVAEYAPSFPKDLHGLDDFFSWQMFVGDAKAAFLYLKRQNGIDLGKVGVLGHSEGGAIALALSGQVHPAGLVLVSTAGRDLAPSYLSSSGKDTGLHFRSKDATKKMVSEAESVLATIKRTGKVPDDVPTDLKMIFPTYLNQYLHDLFLYDPVKDAAKFQRTGVGSPGRDRRSDFSGAGRAGTHGCNTEGTRRTVHRQGRLALPQASDRPN